MNTNQFGNGSTINLFEIPDFNEQNGEIMFENKQVFEALKTD
jgi:hypothetical protein